MARAMRLLGEFSASMAVFDGADEVQRHLGYMCHYARDYLLPSASRHSEETRVSVARSLNQLPIFIEAFANMVKQVTAVDAYTISTLDALLQLLFSQFYRFLGRTIMRCAVAMQRLFVALLNKGDALERLSSSLVGAALLISGAQPLARLHVAQRSHDHSFHAQRS
ncbi:hypothetical protein AB1Y20_001180 [Prymnesium parvum]|uniref:DNA-PKcs N-terminal domain-containing protein n=1 Tax=Prymnesium parvum TaxID=97485 RepID=A0AB34KBT3_PRYPA